MAAVEITLLPMLDDNYAYFLVDPATGTTGVVDPAEAAPVLAHLGGRRLDWILLTHHHADHIAGVPELKELTGARVAGPRSERQRIGSMDLELGEGDGFSFGEQPVAVLETPGHTRGHISFWFRTGDAVFCGDTLFALGCGRLFEGDAATMWRSLGKLAALPDATRVYCGHEYTLSNARFALGIDPGNEALRRRAEDIERLRAAGQPTIPSTIGVEKATNPFLRPADPAIRKQLGLEQASDAEVFGEIRRRKDRG
ncbi:hydroxyacylglutathione hydrolase [Geminicoccaceae bacterium 1502E]|nr:hydroxyacylglutathione hydrolase [Geminicoccaceae bacterium 1502E]